MRFQHVALLLAIVLPVTIGSYCDWEYFRSANLQRESSIRSRTDPAYVGNQQLVGAEDLDQTVFFNLFTRSNPNVSQIIHLNDDESLAVSNFDATKPTRIFIHGGEGDINLYGAPVVRDAYLAVGDYNVFIVDWSAHAKLGYYSSVVVLPKVGKYIGTFIDYFVSKGICVDNLIITGHSFGGHLAGLGAKSAKASIKRIVALDPAGPLFYDADNDHKISTEAAEFVEIIYTNAGQIGYNGSLGHANFYPNGGSNQPGCSTNDAGHCSHFQSYNFFAKSITNPDEFVAQACDSYSNYLAGKCDSGAKTKMGGDDFDTTAYGDFYLKTDSVYPYARNDYSCE